MFLFPRILFGFDARRLNLIAGRGIIVSGRRKCMDASGRNIGAGAEDFNGPKNDWLAAIWGCSGPKRPRPARSTRGRPYGAAPARGVLNKNLTKNLHKFNIEFT